MDPRHLEELEALRKLFVGPEQARLEQSLSPEVVGGLLPEAIAHASRTRGDEVATAIGKPVTSALHDVVRRDPELFGKLLAPTIGTAVRRAVAEAIAAILERVNRAIERSLSVRSFAWRLEARRSGRPFAEVVIAHTLLYRVEWVVLIHTETSLVLEQATVPGAPPAPGLYFCRITLELWGGGIGYEPRPGGGARFWIRLPIASADHGGGAKEAAHG